jgi:RNAse (barnase) inhibitor barstar
MAIFANDPDDWQRLDWHLLRASAVTMYYDPDVLAKDVAWLEKHDYRVRTIQTAEIASPAALLAAFAESLQFPDYFGRNLDALNDCLSDLDIPDDGGLVLILQDYDAFSRRFPSLAHQILDICASNSRIFLLTGKRFVILMSSRDPRITFDPVGATPVLWNPQEWLDATRGL